MSVVLVTRAGKGSPLTNTELDSNFTSMQSAIEALQSGGSASVTLGVHLFAGANAAAQAIAALKSLNTNATVVLPTPVILDFRGCSSPVVLSQDICGTALLSYDHQYVTWLWGNQEVRVAVDQQAFPHHQHVLSGAQFVSKNADGTTRIGSLLFVGNTLSTSGCGTTSGSAVISKTTPTEAIWQRLEVGSNIGVFGFVSTLGVDSTLLDGAIDASVTTITVDSTASFPAGPRYIRIGNEIIQYTSKTGTTFTGCVRGFQGTTAATHADNAVTARPSYKPFTVISIAPTTVTLDGTVDFTSTNTNVLSGPKGFRLEGFGSFDGLAVQGSAASGGSSSLILYNASDFYVGPDLDFRNFDSHAVLMKNCIDGRIDYPRAKRIGSPTLFVGAAFWVFGWSRDVHVLVDSVEDCYIGAIGDTRTTGAGFEDGPVEDCIFHVRHARRTDRAVQGEGLGRCTMKVDEALDTPAGGYGILLHNVQWATNTASFDNDLEVGAFTGGSGAMALQVQDGGNNRARCRTRGAPVNIEPGSYFDPFTYTLAIAYSATMATDAGIARRYTITPTDTTAFTISNPTNPTDDAEIEYTFLNSSGGTMGTPTFGAAFKLGAAFDKPANGKTRVYRFRYNGTNWLETYRSPADIS